MYFYFYFQLRIGRYLHTAPTHYTRRLQSADIDTNTEETAATNVAKDKNTDTNNSKKTFLLAIS